MSCRKGNANGGLLTIAQRVPFHAFTLTMLFAIFAAFAHTAFAASRLQIAYGKTAIFLPLRQSEAKQVSQSQSANQARQQQKLLIKVVDENGVAVASARVTAERAGTQAAFKGETDYAGRHEFTDLESGLYNLLVEKEGYYAMTLNDIRVGETEVAEITLNHVQEFAEVMDVYNSPPAIDPSKTAANEKLTSQEIINLPYPTTRDIRNLLPLIPGVIQDASGQIHVDGSASYQTLDQLDGFNITHPVSGFFELRVSADAVRSIEVERSRYSAEHGKGSGGVLSLATGMGDDRYRFSAANFIPAFQNRKGINLDNWTPRATLSGPLRKKRAWFFEAADFEYNLDIAEELPEGADRNRTLRASNLAKAQVNLTQANIFTASFLVNNLRSPHSGLSRFNPVETTRDEKGRAYLLTLKDQSYFSNGLLLEIGFGLNQFRAEEIPLGRLPFILLPEGRRGNYFKTTEAIARRLQWIARLTLPAVKWHGRHEFKFGTDIDRITYHQFSERRSILILREDGTLSRKIDFVASPRFHKNNFEASAFAQDRWSLRDRFLLEFGFRLDWDQIIRDVLVSPRLAFSYVPTRDGNTKIAAGVGLIYDSTNLAFITRSLDGQRVDFFYESDGQTLKRPPIPSSFQVNERGLKAPRFINWSAGLERKLPASLYLRTEFIGKRGKHGFAFVDRRANEAGQSSGVFQLTNERRDRYTAFQATLRRAFKNNYEVLASYTRSVARSNAVFDFSIDNPIFSGQSGGRLAWDAPNRFMSWGWLPLVKKFDLACSLEWRDGYPFSLVNQDQQIVGGVNSQRLPDYFSLNLHAERRFRLFGFQWALRAGFDNVTNRANPTGVNNNIDSPQFLTFGGFRDRTFGGRIRFLGRK